MSRLIQDMIRKALADELLFGRLVTGGKVTVDLDEKDQIKLDFSEGDMAPPAAPQEAVEIE
jgi:ATP-dependent Clp protease ATP-binding subunit ClpA